LTSIGVARSRNTNRNRRERKERARASGPALPVAERLEGAEEALDALKHAVENLENAATPSRARTAIRNFVNDGRSVAWTLGHLKSEMATEAEWDEWWDDAMKEVRQDPVAQWFYSLRNPIVKEGQPIRLGSITREVRPFSVAGDEAPPGAVGFEMDLDLQPWWRMADGTRVSAGPVPTKHFITLAGIPLEFNKEPLPELMQRYVGVLERLVAAARKRFGEQ
jgi:hypothetical protein